MLAIDYEKCTGCGACVQRCPKQCISWASSGQFGFRYPHIDETACIDCGLCETVCPIDDLLVEPPAQKAYAAVHKSPEVLAGSTSGGAFTAIADAVFTKNGVVYGAAMQKDMQVKHIRTESRADFLDIRGSKYIQSDTGSTYRSVEQDLQQGKLVLYSGTPCQIDGLKHYLSKNYDNLYTADIVCHGVGSQAYFDKYMDFARERYGRITELRFRSKEYAGWSCSGVVVINTSDSKSEKIIPFHDFDNYYYSYFLSGDIYRICCYSCKYANTKRVGDFSLGDYWGVEALNLPLHTENGCSLLLVNNERAKELLDTIGDLDKVETTIEQAARCNKQLNAPSSLPAGRMERLEEFETMSAQMIQKKYLKKHRLGVTKGQLKALMPYKLKLLIRSKRK